MKRNLLLFIALIILLSITYFVQERPARREYIASLTRDKVITTEIQQLKLPQVEARKTNGQWRSPERLLSHNTFRQIEKWLGELKKIKSIEGDPESFFKQPFNFEVNGTTYILGQLALDQQSFYLARDKEIMLAIIEGESHEIATDEKEMAASKYLELKKLLSSSLDELTEKQLFRYYPQLPLASVAIDSDGLPGYELRLDSNQTVPPPIAGVSVHDDLKNKLMSLLTQITLREEVSYTDAIKGVKMASMAHAGEGAVMWELRLPKKGSASVHLIDHSLQRAWLMVGGTLRAFFVTVQDYWDKKVIPAAEFKSFSRLPVRLVQGELVAELVVVNQQPLKFEAAGFSVQTQAMMELFNIIFNLGQLDQADRVSPLTSTDRQQLLNQNLLQLEVMGQQLILWPKPSELIVANLTQGLKLHFLGERENFNAQFKDVLK
jgi:hypothetical protein